MHAGAGVCAQTRVRIPTSPATVYATTAPHQHSFCGALTRASPFLWPLEVAQHHAGTSKRAAATRLNTQAVHALTHDEPHPHDHSATFSYESTRRSSGSMLG